MSRIRSMLICHDGAALNQVGLARWLGSFSQVVGIIVILPSRSQAFKRVRREWNRSGLLGLLDVAAFRAYYTLFHASKDAKWQADQLAQLKLRYPELPGETPYLFTQNPNSDEAFEFIRNLAPDLLIARCKILLKERIFTLPGKGTWVMHPGICPEYRNAHGCFWALAMDDLEHVGMTLLKVDRGIDTGPVYGYFTYPFDAVSETHTRIQLRVVLDNLEAIRDKLLEIIDNQAKPIDVSGRPSAVWGHPRFTRYLRWKRRARARRR